MDTFNFETYWRALPKQVRAAINLICLSVSGTDYKDHDSKKVWVGKLFWAYITKEGKGPKEQLLFRKNVDRYTQCDWNTLARVSNKGLGSQSSKIAFCYSAHLHEKHYKISIFNFIFDFIKYCSERNSSFNFETLSSTINHFRESQYPPLGLPQPRVSNGINHFANRAIKKIVGRENELAKLRAFIDSNEQFSWFQIAGSSGMGKSRLAYEMVIEARERGWIAGFWKSKHDLSLNTVDKFESELSEWNPTVPHLIVFDYVLGREKTIKTLLEFLCSKSNQKEEKVRLILVERQSWYQEDLKATNSEKEKHKISNNKCSAWFMLVSENGVDNHSINQCRFESGFLELGGLNEDNLLEIIKLSFEITTGKKFEETHIKRVTLLLQSCIHEGNPLFASFIGQYYDYDTIVNLQTREHLLNEVLTRDYHTRWKAVWGSSTPAIGEDIESMRLAVLSNIVGGLDVTEAKNNNLLGAVSKHDFNQALTINGTDIADSAFFTDLYIPALQPDILREWFVLSSLKGTITTENIMGIAWKYNPVKTSNFLLRLIQDFASSSVTQKILNFRPNDQKSWKELSSNSFQIASKLTEENLNLPEHILQCDFFNQTNDFIYNQILSIFIDNYLAFNVEARPCSAERMLAEINNRYDFIRSYAKYNWYVPASDYNEIETKMIHDWTCRSLEGCGFSSFNLGFSYFIGGQVNPDMKLANKYLKSAAEQGYEAAKLILGVIYYTGIGVEKCFDTAVNFFTSSLKDNWVRTNEILALHHFFWGTDNSINIEKTKYYLQKSNSRFAKEFFRTKKDIEKIGFESSFDSLTYISRHLLHEYSLSKGLIIQTCVMFSLTTKTVTFSSGKIFNEKFNFSHSPKYFFLNFDPASLLMEVFLKDLETEKSYVTYALVERQRLALLPSIPLDFPPSRIEPSMSSPMELSEDNNAVIEYLIFKLYWHSGLHVVTNNSKAGLLHHLNNENCFITYKYGAFNKEGYRAFRGFAFVDGYSDAYLMCATFVVFSNGAIEIEYHMDEDIYIESIPKTSDVVDVIRWRSINQNLSIQLSL